ncbi:MAG: hypothetical protein PHV30_03550 [Candidatus Margulisbacteria bacterium]|nr:hypothetical protein [Candidatus Margulisiibacteriota bacterium]
MCKFRIIIYILLLSVVFAVTVKKPDGSIQIFPDVPTEGIIISSNGNIGIGILNPKDRLEVAGGVSASGTVTAAAFVGDGSRLGGLVTAGQVVSTANYAGTSNIALNTYHSNTADITVSMNAQGLFGAISVATNNNIMSITPAGNVGIGTNNPGSQLNLQRNQYSANPQLILNNQDMTNDVGYEPEFQIQRGGNPAFTFSTYYHNDSIYYSDITISTGNWLRLYGNSNRGTTGRIDLTASGIYLNGSVYPQGALMLSRTGDAASIATQKKSNAQVFQSSLWNGSSAVGVYSAIVNLASTTIGGSSRLALIAGTSSTGVGGIEAISIDNISGNVGIGISAPSAMLHVSGNITGQPIFIAENSSAPNSLFVSSNGYVGVGTSNPRELFDVWGHARIRQNLYLGDAESMLLLGSNYDIQVKGWNAGDATYVPIATFLKTSVAGNTGKLGVGTTMPNATLHVSGNIAGQPIFVAENSSAPNAFVVTGSGNVGIGTTNPQNGTLEISGTANVIPLYVFGSGPLTQGVRNTVFFTGANSTGGTGLAIENSGVAAIGTKTNINSYMKRTTGGQTLVGQLEFMMQDVGNTSYSSAFSIRTAANGSYATRLYISPSGNIGISVVTPSATLDIGGTVSAASLVVNGTLTANNFVGSGAGLTDVQSNTATTSNMAVSMNAQGLLGAINVATDNNVFNITSAGNVGIGTTTPAYSLDTVGIIRAKGGAIYSTQASPTNTLVINGTSSTLHKIYSNSTVDLSLGTNNSTNQLYLQNGGNVGIGNITPDSKLKVEGAIATTINIKSSDYTLSASDSVILVSANADVTLTLPLASGCSGRKYNMKKVDNSLAKVYISGSGSDTIDSNSNYTLFARWQFASVVSDGNNWYVIEGN